MADPGDAFIWNVVLKVRSLRGDPDGFWKSNDYHLFVCREGLLATKLDAFRALQDYFLHAHGIEGLVIQGVAALFGGKSASQVPSQIVDDGAIPLVRYPWGNVTRILAHRKVFGVTRLRIEGKDYRHSYSGGGRNGLARAADEIEAIAPQLLVRERKWI